MLVSIRPPGSSTRLELAVSPDGTWEVATSGGKPDIGDGMWALPGLADAHSHLAADRLVIAPGEPSEIRRRAFACLDRGTFLVIDKGWGDDVVVATLTGQPPDQVPDFEAAGGVIRSADGYYTGFGVETDAAGLSGVVAEAVATGRGWVKLIGDWPRRGQGVVANFDDAALATVVDIAHAGGARVAIHTMGPEVPAMAVRAGVDSIEHGLFLSRADLADLASRGGAWVPTVVAMEGVLEMLGEDSSGGRLIREGLDNVEDLLSDLPDDVTVLAGTDLATDPGAVATEVEGLIACGLAPDRAVDAASASVRAYLGRADPFQPGAAADVVLFGVDPYDDPTVLARPELVMRSGRVRA